MEPATPGNFVDRLQRAIAARDLDALADCFAEDYVNETPAHPSRGFRGRAQVVQNWRQLMSLDDLVAEVPRATVDGDTVWSEWEMRGTRPGGARTLLRGVVIFGIVAGRARWARFFLEPVDDSGDTVDDVVARAVRP
jgi:ketosteroid isomerase-like protein